MTSFFKEIPTFMLKEGILLCIPTFSKEHFVYVTSAVIKSSSSYEKFLV